MDGQSSNSVNDARMRLRTLAEREPLALRLLEPDARPLLLAFAGGLALGGFRPARRWLWRRFVR